MELVRAASLTGYFEVANQLGLDPQRQLRRAGLSRSMIAKPEQMIPARSVVELLEGSARESGCDTLGLRMAEQRQLSDIGPVSLLIVHQASLHDALDVLSEYRHRINSNLILHVEDHGDSVFLREEFALNPPIFSRQVNDVALGVLYKVCRSLMPDHWRPNCVCFSCERPKPADRPVYERIFECSVQFGSDFDGIVVSPSDYSRRKPQADEALASHARQLVRATFDPGYRTVKEEVEQSIRAFLPGGRACIGEVAHALGTNVRTLQRRLEREGVAFSELLDQARMQQVRQHLASRHLRLTDVAQLLGYSSLASFSTWYRSRFNETPSSGREYMQRLIANHFGHSAGGYRPRSKKNV